jgi:hypothetical protein
LKSILAAASILVFAVGCPDSGGSDDTDPVASNPGFAAPVINPFGLPNVGWNSSPEFVDIDGDGDLDAFIGEYYGDTYYFENTDL